MTYETVSVYRRKDGRKRIADNALVALTLMNAESRMGKELDDAGPVMWRSATTAACRCRAPYFYEIFRCEIFRNG